LPGLIAVLFAMMSQLALGASVPRVDPIAALAGLAAICHVNDDAGGAPAKQPIHPADCLVCPLCVVAHMPSAILVSGESDPEPSNVAMVLRHELPPPSTAPPTRSRSPGQPRAPPILS
jgi:hypothetical protein